MQIKIRPRYTIPSKTRGPIQATKQQPYRFECDLNHPWVGFNQATPGGDLPECPVCEQMEDVEASIVMAKFLKDAEHIIARAEEAEERAEDLESELYEAKWETEQAQEDLEQVQKDYDQAEEIIFLIRAALIEKDTVNADDVYKIISSVRGAAK